MKESSEEIEKKKNVVKNDGSLKLGSIVALKPHPYGPNNTEVKIATYNHLTPPLMTIVEKKKANDFNSETGVKDKTSYKCLYYATISGTFEEHWFKADQIKVIDDSDKNFYKDAKDQNLASLRKELVGKLTSLRSVDFELQKKQVYQDSTRDSHKLIEKNLLDFLPPIGTIISISVNDSHKKYSEKTGEKSLSKNRIVVKFRWFNNKTSKFSEQELPLSSLSEILPHEIREFKRELIYLKEIELKLEGNSKVKIKNIPLKFNDVIYSHYYYQYNFKSLFTGKIISIEQDAIDSINPSTDELKEFFASDFKSQNQTATDYFKIENEKKWKKGWYEIKYLARTGRYTQRIIYINNSVKLNISNKEDEKALEANCLLRNGAIRNFRLKGVLNYRKMPSAFGKEMEGDL